MRIYLLGMMGSGKSYWGRLWARHLNLDFVDLDENIEAAAGLKISRLFAEKGEQYFRELEKKELHKTAGLQNHVIALGGGTPCFFDNMEWIKKHGTSIYLETPIPVLQQRLTQDKVSRPLLDNMSGVHLAGFLENLLIKRKIFYRDADHIFNEQECRQTSIDFLRD